MATIMVTVTVMVMDMVSNTGTTMTNLNPKRRVGEKRSLRKNEYSED